MTASRPTPRTSTPITWRALTLFAITLTIITILAYLPSLNGGFLWDDDQYVTDNTALRSFAGLKAIWSNPQASPQYYPLVFTTFWLEYHLWDLNPLGYRLVNLALHIAAALILSRILLRLHFPLLAALLAAALFALHPVQVESVAWITERKNTLSAFFALTSALLFLRFVGFAHDSTSSSGTSDLAVTTNQSPPPHVPDPSQWPTYALAILCFIAALLSKTVSAVLPPSLLVILWWQRRLTLRLILLILPMLALGIAAGLFTAHFERTTVGALGPEWNLSFIDRTLIAGRALWHYLLSFTWPSSLTFIYPRWHINPASPIQWLAPISALLILLAAFFLLKRHRDARPFLAVALLFIGALVPALGYLNNYPMRFSFVADHFSYLASISLLSAFAWLLWKLTAQFEAAWKSIILITPLLALAAITHNQSRNYTDLETLWSRTAYRNPQAWIAWNALSHIHMHDADPSLALAYADRAIAIAPHAAEPHTNRGAALRKLNREDEAITSFQRALELRSDFAYAHLGLAEIFHDRGQLPEAESHYRAGIKGHPWLVLPHFNLATLLADQNRIEEALVECNAAVNLAPNDPDLRCFHAALLASLNRYSDARESLRFALTIAPDHPRASEMLGQLEAAMPPHTQN